jgi:hypothetical protein
MHTKTPRLRQVAQCSFRKAWTQLGAKSTSHLAIAPSCLNNVRFPVATSSPSCLDHFVVTSHPAIRPAIVAFCSSLHQHHTTTEGGMMHPTPFP